MLSWVPTRSYDDRVSEPLLRPVPRIIPLVGGVDFPPLVLV